MRFTKRIIAFALVALTVCACFAFGVSADTEEKKPIWVTHFNDSTVEGAGVIFTESYQGCAWWLHISFAPASEVGVYEVKEISDGTLKGEGTPLAIPEGGFVYAANYGNNWPALGHSDKPNYVTEACSGCIDGLKASVQVGQKYHFYGLDLENKTVLAGRTGGVPAMTFEYVVNKHGLKNGENITLNNDIAFNLMGPSFEGGTGDYTTLFEPLASEYHAHKTDIRVAR